MQRNFVAQLGRYFPPKDLELIGGPYFEEGGVGRFVLAITTHSDGDHNFSAHSEAFGDMLIGVGTSHKRAAADLVEAMKSVIDHHVARGTCYRFIDKFAGGTMPVKDFLSPAKEPVTFDDQNQPPLPWMDDIRDQAVA